MEWDHGPELRRGAEHPGGDIPIVARKILALGPLGALLLTALAVTSCGSAPRSELSAKPRCAPQAASTDDGSANTEQPLVHPNSADAPITIDFVRKDIHVVAHLLSIKSGWRFTIDQDVQKEVVTFSARSVWWADLLETICESSDLTFESDEAANEVKIHRNAGRFTRFDEVRVDAPTGRIEACMAFVDVNHAIVTIARLTQTPFRITTALSEEKQWKPGVFVYHRARASLYADNISVEDAFHILARQGDMTLRWGNLDPSTQGWLFEPMPLK